jgi:type II secretion system protein J
MNRLVNPSCARPRSGAKSKAPEAWCTPKPGGIPGHPGAGKGKCSGFTLIELVISSALMALILVSAYLCLNSGISSQKLIESRSDAVQSARVVLAMISADLRAACPLSKDIEFLGMHRMLDDVEADNLDFGTHHYSPRRAGEGDFCQMSYFVAKDPDSGKLSLWRRRNPTIGLDPLAGGKREEIIRGLRGLRFEYYDGFDWFEEWGDPTGKGKAQTSQLYQPNLSGMPEAVRITLWLEPSSGSSRRASQEGADAEPPLVFETVARLNLAAISRRNSSSASSEPKPATPDGGAPQ